MYDFGTGDENAVPDYCVLAVFGPKRRPFLTLFICSLFHMILCVGVTMERKLLLIDSQFSCPKDIVSTGYCKMSYLFCC